MSTTIATSPATTDLQATAASLVTGGRGILAADESVGDDVASASKPWASSRPRSSAGRTASCSSRPTGLPAASAA